MGFEAKGRRGAIKLLPRVVPWRHNLCVRQLHLCAVCQRMSVWNFRRRGFLGCRCSSCVPLEKGVILH